jgi:hypothetical protein
VLILSGDRDPLVPTDITLELLRIFPDAHVLPAAGAAHPAAGWSDCARNAVHEFVRTLSRPAARCDQPAWAVFTTSKFPRSVHTAVPAPPKQGDKSRMLDRKLVTTTVQAVRDAWIRTWRIPGEVGPLTGLRGGTGRFDYATFPDHATVKLRRVRFTSDVAITGDATWNYENSKVRFHVRVDGPGRSNGTLRGQGLFLGWFPGTPDDFMVTGSLDGRRVVAAVPAN